MADRRQHLLSELGHAELWLIDVSRQVEIATKRVDALRMALREGPTKKIGS